MTHSVQNVQSVQNERQSSDRVANHRQFPEAPEVSQQLPPQTLADLASIGATFVIHGVVLVVPETATSSDIFKAMDLLDRLGQERYVAEGVDCGGT